MAAVVKLNRAGIIEVLKSSEVEAALMSVAEAAAAAARASAPVSSGAYQDSISAFTEMHADRVVAHVSSDAPHAMAVEAATGNLARALGG
jgi:hypothetical protein